MGIRPKGQGNEERRLLVSNSTIILSNRDKIRKIPGVWKRVEDFCLRKSGVQSIHQAGLNMNLSLFNSLKKAVNKKKDDYWKGK